MGRLICSIDISQIKHGATVGRLICSIDISQIPRNWFLYMYTAVLVAVDAKLGAIGDLCIPSRCDRWSL